MFSACRGQGCWGARWGGAQFYDREMLRISGDAEERHLHQHRGVQYTLPGNAGSGWAELLRRTGWQRRALQVREQLSNRGGSNVDRPGHWEFLFGRKFEEGQTQEMRRKSTVEAKLWNAVRATFKSFNFIQKDSPPNSPKASKMDFEQGSKWV